MTIAALPLQTTAIVVTVIIAGTIRTSLLFSVHGQKAHNTNITHNSKRVGTEKLSDRIRCTNRPIFEILLNLVHPLVIRLAFRLNIKFKTRTKVK